MKKECREFFSAYLRNLKLFVKTRADSQKAVSLLWVEALAKQLVEELKVLYKTNDIEELIDLVRYQTGVDKRTLRRFIKLGKMPHPRVLERIVLYSRADLVLTAVPICSNSGKHPVVETVDSPGLVRHKLNTLVHTVILRSTHCKTSRRERYKKADLYFWDLPHDDQLETVISLHGEVLSKLESGKFISFAAAQVILRSYGMRLMISIKV